MNTASGLQPASIERLAYSLPMIATYFLFYPVQILLAGIYAKYYGIPLTTIATVVLAARLFDALTDPIIGYFSDYSRAKSGTRKPWVVIGSLCLVVSSYYLWAPPIDVGVVYFAAWYFAFYLAWTIVEIPHLSWGGELTTCGDERTKIYSIRTACVFIGQMIFSIAPLLPFWSQEGFTPETLKWSVLASAVAILPLLYVCLRLTPNGRESVKPQGETPSLVVTAILQNGPLINLLAGFFLISLSYGLYIGLSFIFADTYLGLGEQLPVIFAFSTTMGAVASAVVFKLATHMEKNSIYAFAVVLSGLAMVSLSLLGPGASGLYIFAILTCAIYFGNAMVLITVPSILADIADYGSWRFKADRTATYFSVYYFWVKAIVGLGGALGLAIVGWYGFDATAQVHSDESIEGLHLAIAYLPALLMFVALFAIVKKPLNARRHRIIGQRLALRLEREDRASRLAPEKVGVS